ncbi:hypothetical protein NDU88_000160 [Pleurodeles waltl]|uniref:Uncharacterized protein n=1 Tax=Pleurodeles waltl TaxID=8319 RepID=A0AAV7UR19_PLEWA|nr:hypothetical protein NDU88_000160 [Pleurodeles waltl]
MASYCNWLGFSSVQIKKFFDTLYHSFFTESKGGEAGTFSKLLTLLRFFEGSWVRWVATNRKCGEADPSTGKRIITVARCSGVDEYVADLKKGAVPSKFDSLHNDLIRDQIVMHSNALMFDKKLWANKDTTLKDAIAIAKKAELSGCCAKQPWLI